MTCIGWMMFTFVCGSGCTGEWLLASYSTFPICWSGPGTPACPGCAGRFDLDDDGDVDFRDFAVYQTRAERRETDGDN